MRNTDQYFSRIKNDIGDYRSKLKKFRIPNNKKAIIQILNTMLPFLAMWVIMYLCYDRHFYVTCGVGFVNGLFLVRLFAIQHDCGHHSYTSSKTANNLIRDIISLFSAVPGAYWEQVHNFHHANTSGLEQPGRDVGDIPTKTVREYRALSKFRRLKYRLSRSLIVMFIISPIAYFSVVNKIPHFAATVFRKRAWVTVKRCLKDNALLSSVYILCIYFMKWKFVFIQAYLILIFGIIAFWLFYVQHQHEHGYKQWKENLDKTLAAILGATYYKLPKALQWLTGNIGFHPIHHLDSQIPNYHLEQCVEENPELLEHSTTITIKESLKYAKFGLWSEDESKMITFKEEKDLILKLRKVA